MRSVASIFTSPAGRGRERQRAGEGHPFSIALACHNHEAARLPLTRRPLLLPGATPPGPRAPPSPHGRGDSDVTSPKHDPFYPPPSTPSSPPPSPSSPPASPPPSSS